MYTNRLPSKGRQNGTIRQLQAKHQNGQYQSIWGDVYQYFGQLSVTRSVGVVISNVGMMFRSGSCFAARFGFDLSAAVAYHLISLF
jgi:hypothetical protein